MNYKNSEMNYKNSEMNYKNIHALRKFLTQQGRILPRRQTQLSAKQHRTITKLIKQARILGFLRFIPKK